MAAVFAAALFAAAPPPRPHIFHIVADDLGWAEVGWHRPYENATAGEVRTPALNALVRDGVELDRFYAHKICSPTRCALQTGRAPIHVNVQNVPPEVRNADDPAGGWQGIPVNMTGVAQVLRRAGYRTHLVGKWDAGSATPRHTPHGRGYDSWLGYFHHSNDYWSHAEGSCRGQGAVRDLWRHPAPNASAWGAPAAGAQNGAACSQARQQPAGQPCVFEEALLADAVRSVISAHDAAHPLFLLWTMHLVHMPLQVPDAYLARFRGVLNPFRRKMDAMVAYMDDRIGEAVALLRSRGMWGSTLVVFHADNGGEIVCGAGGLQICGGNNWPLRGGKFSNWEGGVRLNAFVSGGLIPPARRGAREEGYVAVEDWYATYAALAGEPHHDAEAERAGLPGVDGVDAWPLLSGAPRPGAPPRAEVWLGDSSALEPNGDGATLVGGLLQGRWKLVIGAADRLHTISQDVRTGPDWPNDTSTVVPLLAARVCARDASRGCLFDVFADPYEERSVAAEHADVFAAMLARVDELQQTVYSPRRGRKDPAACAAAARNGGYWGPFSGAV